MAVRLSLTWPLATHRGVQHNLSGCSAVAQCLAVYLPPSGLLLVNPAAAVRAFVL